MFLGLLTLFVILVVTVFTMGMRITALKRLIDKTNDTIVNLKESEAEAVRKASQTKESALREARWDIEREKEKNLELVKQRFLSDLIRLEYEVEDHMRERLQRRALLVPFYQFLERAGLGMYDSQIETAMRTLLFRDELLWPKFLEDKMPKSIKCDPWRDKLPRDFLGRVVVNGIVTKSNRELSVNRIKHYSSYYETIFSCSGELTFSWRLSGEKGGSVWVKTEETGPEICVADSLGMVREIGDAKAVGFTWERRNRCVAAWWGNSDGSKRDAHVVFEPPASSWVLIKEGSVILSLDLGPESALTEAPLWQWRPIFVGDRLVQFVFFRQVDDQYIATFVSELGL